MQGAHKEQFNEEVTAGADRTISLDDQADPMPERLEFRVF